MGCHFDHIGSDFRFQDFVLGSHSISDPSTKASQVLSQKHVKLFHLSYLPGGQCFTTVSKSQASIFLHVFRKPEPTSQGFWSSPENAPNPESTRLLNKVSAHLFGGDTGTAIVRNHPSFWNPCALHTSTGTTCP